MRSTPSDSSAAATPTTSSNVSSSPSSSSSSVGDPAPVDLRLGVEQPPQDGGGPRPDPVVERRAFDRIEQLPRTAPLGRQVARSRERERPQTLPAHLRGRRIRRGGRAPRTRRRKPRRAMRRRRAARPGACRPRRRRRRRRRGRSSRPIDCRAIIAAIVPAPTPSSTFTHATPGAHEESIDRSAARPPSDAP